MKNTHLGNRAILFMPPSCPSTGRLKLMDPSMYFAAGTREYGQRGDTADHPKWAPTCPVTAKWPLPVRWRRGDGRRDLFASIGFDIPVLTLLLAVTTVDGDCSHGLIFIWSPSFNGYELLLDVGPPPWWWWIWMRADVFKTFFFLFF